MRVGVMVWSIMGASAGYGIEHASGKSREWQTGVSEAQKSGRLPKDAAADTQHLLYGDELPRLGY
jgi:hypothetical protein